MTDRQRPDKGYSLRPCKAAPAVDDGEVPEGMWPSFDDPAFDALPFRTRVRMYRAWSEVNDGMVPQEVCQTQLARKILDDLLARLEET